MNRDQRLNRLEDHFGLTSSPLLTAQLVTHALDALKKANQDDTDVTHVDGFPMELIDKWVRSELKRLQLLGQK